MYAIWLLFSSTVGPSALFDGRTRVCFRPLAHRWQGSLSSLRLCLPLGNREPRCQRAICGTTAARCRVRAGRRGTRARCRPLAHRWRGASSATTTTTTTTLCAFPSRVSPCAPAPAVSRITTTGCRRARIGRRCGGTRVCCRSLPNRWHGAPSSAAVLSAPLSRAVSRASAPALRGTITAGCRRACLEKRGPRVCGSPLARHRDGAFCCNPSGRLVFFASVSTMRGITVVGCGCCCCCCGCCCYCSACVGRHGTRASFRSLAHRRGAASTSAVFLFAPLGIVVCGAPVPATWSSSIVNTTTSGSCVDVGGTRRETEKEVWCSHDGLF